MGVTTRLSLWCAAPSSCFKAEPLLSRHLPSFELWDFFSTFPFFSLFSSPSFSFISSAKFPFTTQFAPPPEILTHFICCLLGKKIKGLHLCQFKVSINKRNQSIYAATIYLIMWRSSQVCAPSLKQEAKIHFLFLKEGMKSIPNETAKSPFPAEDRATFTTGTAQEKVESSFQSRHVQHKLNSQDELCHTGITEFAVMDMLYNPHQILRDLKMQEGQTRCHCCQSTQFSTVHREHQNTPSSEFYLLQNNWHSWPKMMHWCLQKMLYLKFHLF